MFEKQYLKICYNSRSLYFSKLLSVNPKKESSCGILKSCVELVQTVVDLEGLGSNPGSSSEQLSLFGEVTYLL